MRNEWKNIDETTRNRLEEALDQREMNFKGTLRNGLRMGRLMRWHFVKISCKECH